MCITPNVSVCLPVCGSGSIDQRSEAIKTLGTYLSYNIKIKEKSNFIKIFSNVQSVFKLWRLRNLTFERQLVVCEFYHFQK